MHRFHLWAAGPTMVIDLLCLGAVTLLGLFDAAVRYRSGSIALVPVPLLFGVPLWFRTRKVVFATYATATLGLLSLLVLPYPPAAGIVAALIMAYAAAANATRWHARVALWLALLGGPVAALRTAGPLAHLLRGYVDLSSTPGTRSWWFVYAIAALLGTGALVNSWLLGAMVHARQAYLRAALDRAARLEREREALDRVAVARERARIARELHDVVAHSLSVVGAPGGRRRQYPAVPIRSAATRRSRTIGTDQLGRRVDGTARGCSAYCVGLIQENAATRRPHSPAWWASTTCAVRLRATGLPVTVESTVRLAEIPPGVGLTAYRIVQEALTRMCCVMPDRARPRPCHCGLSTPNSSSRCSTMGREADPQPAHPGTGYWACGNALAALGGILMVGPRPDENGYQVICRLPPWPIAADSRRRETR